MAAVCNLECLMEDSHTLRDPIFYLHIKFGEDIFIDGRSMPQKSHLKQPITVHVCIIWEALYLVPSL